MSRVIGALVLAAMGLGCAPTVQLSVPEEDNTIALDAALMGTWRVEGMMQSDCPAEWMRRLPTGHTRWTEQQGALVIESMAGDSETVTLHPVASNQLESEGALTIHECTVTETLRLDIDTLDGPWASGVYEAQLAHDGSPERCRFGGGGRRTRPLSHTIDVAGAAPLVGSGMLRFTLSAVICL